MAAVVVKPVIKLPPRSKSISTNRTPEIMTNELFFEDKDSLINDFDLQQLLEDYNLLHIKRERGGGYLSFPDTKTAERVYSLFNGYMFSNQTTFKITLEENVKIEGPILEVRHLPTNIDRNHLYDIFRPYGPLNICQLLAESGSPRGRALIQYFFKESSEAANADLNGKLFDGNIIQITTILMNGNLISRYPFNKSPSPVVVEAKEGGGFIDYTNLYVKNLDPTVDNNDLFTIFRKFGRIVSARVMTNPQNGQSKGYGFVSFSKSEEAAAARDEMNGVQVRTKPMIVAFHEPKKPRQEKSSSTTTSSFHSPPPSAPIDYATPPYFETRHPHEVIPIHGHGFENMEHLAAIPEKSPVVENTFTPPPIRTSPQFNSRPSLASLASRVSIQPVPIYEKIQEEPELRRKGSHESIHSVMTESSARIQRQRMVQAVKRCGDYGNNLSDLVDMLLTLKRKDRSICLFNPDFLKVKIEAALDALEICEVDEEEEHHHSPVSKKEHRNVQIDAKASSPPLPLPNPIPPTPTTHHFIESVVIPPRVSKAIPIVAPPPESPKLQEIMASLEGKQLHEKKQLLGDQLFPLVKATGVKGAPKITIRLLDTIELETLAKLMFDKEQLKTRIDKVIATL